MSRIWNFASYNLLLLHSPPVGWEYSHCDMKRGFIKARKREPRIQELLDIDNTYQRIGLLAQRGVYEFHNNNLLSKFDNIEVKVSKLADILQINCEAKKVRDRVIKVLKNYCQNPILVDKDIINLSRGDEGFPEPILIEEGNYQFNLYAAIDCTFRETDGRIHILDFKTGKSDFDKRQAYIYLLAASYLYPQQQAIASFYNLETQTWSQAISATSEMLQTYQNRLMRLSQKHQQQMKAYWNHREKFERIFPANPGIACRYCPFNSICQFVDKNTVLEVAS